MIGDPYLEDENRSEWASLVKDCLHETKNCTPDAFSNIALSGLKTIYETFEDVTIQSQFFQVSGRSPPVSVRRRLLRPKPATKYKNCICDGNVTVRMWSTADEDEIVPSEDGDPLRCVWHGKSNYHQPLRQITCGEYWPKDCGLPVEADGSSNTLLPTASDGADENSVPGDPLTDALSLPNSSHSDSQHIKTTHIETGPNTQRDDVGSPAEVRDDYGTSSESNEQPDVNIGNTYELTNTEDGVTSNWHLVPPSQGAEDNLSFTPELKVRNDSDAMETILLGDDYTGSSDSDLEALRPLEPNAKQGATALSAKMNLRPRKRPLSLALPVLCEQFIGRNDIMNSLARAVFTTSPTSENGALARPSPMTAILCGQPGIGKTQIARHFVERFGNHFENTFWVHADSHQSITRSIHEIAIALGLVNGRRNHCHDDSAAECRTWFTTAETPWLLILDDAQASDDILPYFRNCKSGSIIVTTRHRRFDSFGQVPTSSILEIPPFTDEESRQYLVKHTRMSWKSSFSETTQRFIKMMGGYPLALTQIAGTMNESQSDCLPDLSPLALHMNLSHKDIRYSTTLQQLLAVSNGALSTKAQKLFAVLAYLNPHGISDSLLLAQNRLDGIDDYLPADENELITIIHELTRAHLIQVTQDAKSVQVHNERQDVLRSLLDLKQNKIAFRVASKACHQKWPSVKKFRNVLEGFWPEFDELHGHAHHLTTHWRPQFDSSDDFAQLITLSSWYDFVPTLNFA